MKRTLVIRRDYLQYVSKYRRYEKRAQEHVRALLPAFENVGEGDSDLSDKCRPLAKTVKFNVIDHSPNTNKAINVKKIFRVF